MFHHSHVRIHADDFGLTESVNQHVIECVDAGIVNSVSLMPNGWGVEHAVAEIIKRPFVLFSIHLNFLTGAPVTPAVKIPLLLNENGMFDQTVQQLYGKYYFSSAEKKQALREQIQIEAEAQIQKTLNAFKDHDFEIRLDSERFTHLIPFIFDIFLELKNKYSVKYVRTPFEPLREMLRLLRFTHPDLLKNIPKYFVASLSQTGFRFRKRLAEENIDHPDFLVGLSRLGFMDKKIIQSTFSTYGIQSNYEFIFHPGRAERDEFPKKFHSTLPLNFTTSEWREREKDALIQFAKENPGIISDLRSRQKTFLIPVKQKAVL